MSGRRFEIEHRQHFLGWGSYIPSRIEKSREGSTNGPYFREFEGLSDQVGQECGLLEDCEEGRKER